MANTPVPYRAKLAATLGIAAVLLGVLATIYFAYFHNPGGDRFAQCRATRVLGGSDAIGGPFTLTDENGARVTEEDVITGPTLVYFGFSYCPDFCPMDATRNAAVVSELRDKGVTVKDVFISIDPERDTPEVMKEFTDYFDEETLGLTGSPEDIAQAARAYRAYYAKNGEGEDYLMDHSTLTYLMAPEIGLLEVFRRDIAIDDMANTVACFVERL